MIRAPKRRPNVACWSIKDIRDTFSRLPPNAGVCLGKFDALHLGHRALAEAARELGFDPWMVSFEGMAEVFGWEARKPLLAPEHRPQVLKSFGARERVLPFSQVQKLSPREFVDLVADELGASAVICGEDFRFGFKAEGDAGMLQALAKERGMEAAVVRLKESKSMHVKYSSSLVRQLLSEGDVQTVASVLGRPYRVFWRRSLSYQGALQVLDPANEMPAPGIYEVSIKAKGFKAQPATAELSGMQGVLQPVCDEKFFCFQNMCVKTTSSYHPVEDII